MDAPMLNGLMWIVAGLSLLAGALALALSGSVLMRERLAANRLSLLLASGGLHPSLIEAAARWLEWVRHKLARNEAAAGEVRQTLARAGSFRAAALYIFLAWRFVLTLTIFLDVLMFRARA